ncbi:serine/arginine repetitive matrix protein 1-like isoform X3 [Portunus trituberculatus]|uniref:serine/arginine repetitive matrix protein 1-like isoform X3 n=1 Tax=Portunus trituberculatus TaxID=210409 RepID=UPI001E1CE147|nr:serine/arginine repetitive matrix protein 1-like isoform X3 [Portunus trituberculatus]
MERSYSSRYTRSDLNSGMASSGTRTGRFLRYSGAHTTTGLDRVAAPSAHEMSYTARKYSSPTYTPGGQRRSGSQENDRARVSQERLTSGRGPSTDRLSSGYSSRRGSSGTDFYSPPSSSVYSSLNSASIAKSATRSSYTGGTYGRTSSETNFASVSNKANSKAEGGRHSNDRDGDPETKYSRLSSARDIPGASSRQGGRQDTPDRSARDKANDPGVTHPPVSAFISGYATLERRNNRRRKDLLPDRKSVDRVLDTSPSFSSLDRRSKYGRTYTCDLPSCRTTPVKDYTKELYSKYSGAARGSNSSSVIDNNSSNNNSYSRTNYNNKSSSSSSSSSSNSRSISNTSTNNRMNRALSPTSGESHGPQERERSPSVRAIYEGLARINQALEKHRSDTDSALPGSTSRTVPPPPPPPPPRPSSSSCPRQSREAHTMKAALAASGSRASGGGSKPTRTRVNKFAPSTEKICIEKQVNVVPRIEIPAEARLAQRRAARAEARELRLRELERQQHEQENDEEKQFASPSYTDDDDCEDDECDEEEEPVSRAGLGRAAARSSGMNCTGQYSRRSSEDSTTDEAALPANVREMRAELKELDEKFRKAMITNAQLDNEKATLTFEVELMKDRYTELEEAHTQLTKEHRKKCTEYEQLRKVSTKLQEEVKILRGMLQERDQLIQEYGLVVMGEEENGDDTDHIEEDDDVDDLSPRKLSVKKVLVSQEAAELLSKGAAKGSLDVRLRKFGEEKNDLEDQVRRLKLELEEERNKNRRRENGLDYEKQKEQSKTVNEYKFRVQKAEAEVSTLQANVVRLDALLTRYKTQSEELESSEEELKLEKRKLQRELRDAQSRLEELETTNNHLIKRFDKLKNARSNLLKDLSQDPA